MLYKSHKELRHYCQQTSVERKRR